MAFLKSVQKFLKTPACGCKKKTRKTYKGKKGSKHRGGYSYRKASTRKASGRKHKLSNQTI